MGQLNLSRNAQSGFDTGSWVEAIEDANNTIFANINPYRNRLLMNKDTAELVEEYELQFISQKDFDSFIAELQLRKEPSIEYNNVVLNRTDAQFRNSVYIYKIRYFQNLSVKELCSTIFHGRLYINKVEVRLKELNDIPFYDQLYLYYVCLSGFKILYQKVGVFQINQEMIFFDQKGQVKVWMNPNLSSFTPNYQPQDYNNEPAQNQGSQSEMLKNLMNIIEENTDKQSVGNNMQFRQYLIEKGLFQRLSFSKALEYFGSYCEQNKLAMSSYMSSIYDLFHQDQHMKRSVLETSEVHKVVYNTNFLIGKTDNETATISELKNHFKSTSNYEGESQTEIRVLELKNQPIGSTNLKSANKQEKIDHINTIQPNLYAHNGFSNIKFQQNNQKQKVKFVQPKITNQSQVHERKHKTQFIYQKNNFLSPSINNRSEVRYRSNTKPQAENKITFSYKPTSKGNFVESVHHVSPFPDNMYPPRKESIIEKLQATVAQREIIKQRDDLKIVLKNELRQQKQVLMDKPFNYFSVSNEYSLDKEIAEDMIKYLGFNPNI